MPFQSKAQAAWAHTKEGTEALGGEAKVKEWDAATDFKKLPKRKKKAPVTPSTPKPAQRFRHTTRSR